ncbi:hypothetical protein Lsan_1842 [Legionella santicrucis]|uniref:Uncharacterized protein n=1 Tax=Legionella santicrucis TaxID=45074 RepID=A0A0W0YWR0_9GAMM|nr:hypothetical protein [Legionella santicrucis]KTD61341.1 hypothetical protein Lsan_1842 [Legionella santicrucis]
MKKETELRWGGNINAYGPGVKIQIYLNGSFVYAPRKNTPQDPKGRQHLTFSFGSSEVSSAEAEYLKNLILSNRVPKKSYRDYPYKSGRHIELIGLSDLCVRAVLRILANRYDFSDGERDSCSTQAQEKFLSALNVKEENISEDISFTPRRNF